MEKNHASQTLKIQEKAIRELAKEVNVLVARFNALRDAGADLTEIQKELGSRIEQTRVAFQKEVAAADKTLQVHKSLIDTDEAVSKAHYRLSTAVGSLNSSYSKLQSQEKQLVGTGQSEITKKLKNEEDAAKKAVKAQEQTTALKRNAAKQALADAKAIAAQEDSDRIQREQKEKEAEARREASRKRLEARQKSHVTRLIAENKRLVAAEDDRLKKERQDAAEKRKMLEAEFRDTKKAIDERRKLQNAAIDVEEKGKFFGQSFRAAFSPQAIGRAIASIVKFIGIYQVLFGTLGAAKDLLIGSAKAYIAFEDSLGKLNAVTLASEEQSKKLASSIRQVAVETRFTATQVAELATSLAKLGATANEIPNLIGPIALAAQATGESLDKVGETILKVNNQFGISSLESALTAATLVSAINESALSLETFNTAIQYIGPIAAQVGLTFGETSEYLKSLADNGFTASRIGTGLRSIFLELKKPGEDISKTLDDLAKKNISVAEAMQLVGKRAAAQLITILRTKETFDSQRSATEALGTSMAAAAAQMSTFAGKVDILKSAFEEFRLKIGESIVNTEIFLELIGLLSTESEALARGYGLINTVAQKNTNALSDNIDAVIGGASAYRTIRNTLEDSGIYMTKFDRTFSQLSRNLQRAGTTLTLDEQFEAFAISINGSEEQVSNFLASIGKLQGANLRLIREIGEAAFPGDIEDESLALLGYFRRVEEGVESYQRAARAEMYRNQIQAEYREELEAIEKLGVKNESAQARAVALEVDIAKKRSDIIKQQKREESKGAGASAERLLQYQAEIDGLDAYMSRLSEFNADLLTEDEGISKNQMSMFNKRRKALDIERQELEDELQTKKELYDQEVERLTKLAKLRADNTESEVERNDILMHLEDQLSKLRNQHQKELESIGERHAKLTQSAKALWKEYNSLWEGNESFLLSVTNAQDAFGLSMKKLIDDVIAQKQKITLNPEDLGIELVQRANAIVSLYSANMQKLAKNTEDTAWAQYQLGLSQRQYFEQTKSLFTELEAEYQKYFDSLIKSGMSDEAAEELTRPMRYALDAMNKMINDANEGILTDEQMAEFKKKFKTISEGFYLSVDTTLAETLQLGIDTALNALSRYNDVAFENTKNRLDAEKEQIKSRFEFEDDILKSKLDNQLITEAEYRAQIERNRKSEIQQQNALDKKIFEAEQKKAKEDAFIDYLTSLNSIIPNLIINDKEGNPVALSLKAAISAAMTTAAYGFEVGAINKRKFIPTKFETGGVVQGPSHEEGGVPFTVNGYSGYEMEGGEYIVNKTATKKYKSLLDRINNYGRSNKTYALGGMVDTPAMSTRIMLEYMHSIAETNQTIVGKLDKPVRSFVSSEDLRSDENARRIKDRNSQL